MFSFVKTISLDTWYAIGAATISFLLGFSTIFMKKWFNKEKKLCKHLLFCGDTGKEFTQVHSQVNEMLTETRLDLDCARAYISQFHNGGDFFSGESILKYSTTHESCGLGVMPTMDTQQGILLTRYVEKLKILQEDEPRIIYTNTLKDGNYKGFLESRNTIAFILIPLRKQEMLSPYGYLCCEWCSWQHAEKIRVQSVFNILEKQIRILNSLLLSIDHGKN